MSAKSRALYNTPTGGNLGNIRPFFNTATDTGVDIDLSEIEYEVKTGVTDYVKIWNTGSKTIYVAFNSTAETIDTTDTSTFNLRISSGTPYSEIGIEGETSKISVKCASGESSTFEVLTW